MPKLNKQLSESLISDLKEFVHIGNELHSRLGDIGHLSWRYPSKLSKNVEVLEVLEKHQGSAGEMYILLLELSYDRIHFVLQFIANYLETYPGLERLFSRPAEKKKTLINFTSAGSTINRIWWHLKYLPESISTITDEVNSKIDSAKFVEKVSKFTQANASQVSCENCFLVSGCLLDLMSKIKNALRDDESISEIVGEQKAVKIDHSDKSQGAVVMRLMHSLTNEVQTLLNSMQHVIKQNEDSKNENNQYSLLVKKLQRELKVKKFELDELSAIRDDLLMSERKITRDMGFLYELNNALENQLSLTLEEKLALEKKLSGLHRNGPKLQTTQKDTDALIPREIDFLEKKLTPLSVSNETLEGTGKTSIKYSYGCEVLEVKKCIDEKSMDENGCENPGLIDGQEISTNLEIIKPGDDPEKDMVRQLQSNKEKICILLQQNERLSKTLNRLHKHRKTNNRSM